MRSTIQRRRQAGSSRKVYGGCRRPVLAPTAGAVCEALERRVLLSKVGPLVDAGDTRWQYGLNQAEKLLRATDQVIVGFQPSSSARVARLSAALTGRLGALAGYRVKQTFGDRYTVLFERTARGPAPALQTLQEKINGFPAVKHLSPTFFSARNWARIIVFDSLYVDLRDGVDPAPIFARGFRNDWSPDGMNAYNATLRRGGAIDALRVAEKLRTGADIEGASADIAAQIIPSSTTPNDTYTWGTAGTSDNRWNLERVHLPDAWDKTTGSPDIVIAVLDDGLQLNHPDFGDPNSDPNSNIFKSVDGPGNGDEDENEYKDDTNGWNFYNNNRDPNPSKIDNHGTPVAGIAAAKGNNATGVTGATWHSKVLPVKIFDNGRGAGDGNQDAEHIASAIRYAAGADDLDGGIGNDWIGGGQDADTLAGGDGNDTLDGGTGADGMYGNAGDDAFYSGADSAADWLDGGPGANDRAWTFDYGLDGSTSIEFLP